MIIALFSDKIILTNINLSNIIMSIIESASNHGYHWILIRDYILKNNYYNLLL